MTDMRTLGIRPDGLKMSRNDNLHNDSSCKLTALELKMLLGVNGVYLMSLFIQR